MIKALLESQKRTEELLKTDPKDVDWEYEMKWFNGLIVHLQHERLIHLIVTMTVGLAGLILCLYSLTDPKLPLLVLDMIFIVLFGAYIFHYRFLENTTQSMYKTLAELKGKLQ